MDQQTEQLFADSHEVIVREAARRYGVREDNVRRLGSFESAVYEVEDSHGPRILKATDSSHRDPEEIAAEWEWVDYLAAGGVPVCRALPSRAGRLVETIDLPGDHRAISLVLMEKAEGERLNAASCSAEMVQRWGECLGAMHARTRSFSPHGLRRHHWHDDPDLVPPCGLSESQPRVVERFHMLLKRLRSIPVDPTTYGLVHIDLHHGNFHVKDSSLRVFDTDDCQYDWFMNDLCIPLYYVDRDAKLGNGSSEWARWFFGHLLEGYNRRHSLDRASLVHVPDFLKLREMILYVIVITEDIAEADDWCRRFMAGRRERIEQDAPVIDLDFVDI